MQKTVRFKTLNLVPLFVILCAGCSNLPAGEEKTAASETEKDTLSKNKIDTAQYDKLIKALSNADTTGKWPAKVVYPLPGALLPH